MTEKELQELDAAERTVSRLMNLKIEEEQGERPLNYRGPLPRPLCDCKTWGCWGCCNTESELRGKQGIYG